LRQHGQPHGNAVRRQAVLRSGRLTLAAYLAPLTGMGKTSNTSAQVSKPGQSFHASRRLNAIEYRLAKAHNQRVGDVIHAYNLAQAALFLIFRDVVVREDYYVAIGMWHSIQSDRAQRAFIEAHIRKTKRINETNRRNILWSLSEMDQLSTFRNDTAHSEVVWSADRLMLGTATKPASRVRLSELPFEQHWRKLKGDLIALSNYIVGLDLSLSLGQSRPLFRRPRLQLVRSSPEKLTRSSCSSPDPRRRALRQWKVCTTICK